MSIFDRGFRISSFFESTFSFRIGSQTQLRRKSFFVAGLVAACVALSSACTEKVLCDVRITTEKVGDEQRTVFVVVNRGAGDIKDATLTVDARLSAEKESPLQSFTAPVREVLSGKERKIGLSLLRGKEGAKFESDLKVVAVRVALGEAQVCAAVAP